MSPFWETLSSASDAPVNVKRWFKIVGNFPKVKSVIQSLEGKLGVEKKEVRRSAPKDEGKFIELPGAEMGKVVVRFPPEASG